MANPLDGVSKLTAKLRALGALEDGNVVRRAVRAGIKPIVQRAKSLIPVGTQSHKTYKGRVVSPGFARKSITSAVSLQAGRTIARGVVGTKKEAFYADQFVELGTRKMAAEPWLVPAFEQTLTQQQEAIKVSLAQDVIRIAGSS